jgi:undecaprenyl-diphosphatase
MAIWLRNRRAGEIALVMAGLLAVSRVAVGTHYPSDVLAGAALGVAAALVFWIPAIRDPLHRFADWLAGIYEAVASAAVARVRAL